MKINSKGWNKKINAKDKKNSNKKIRTKLDTKILWNKMQRNEIETKKFQEVLKSKQIEIKKNKEQF